MSKLHLMDRTGEYDCIMEMCRVHDKEEAAMIGEPDPWIDSEDDDEWREDRLSTMWNAFEVARKYFERKAAVQSGQSFCRGYNKAVTDFGRHPVSDDVWQIATGVVDEMRHRHDSANKASCVVNALLNDRAARAEEVRQAALAFGYVEVEE